MKLDRISIELTNQCQKGCWFCYNHSQPEGRALWTAGELVDFVTDCARNGVEAVSFGGGEPLQYPAWQEVLGALNGIVFRSLTSNGLLLNETVMQQMAQTGLEKVHLSIHFPERRAEVDRVIAQVHRLEAWGIRSGINLLVARSQLKEATKAAESIRQSGIGNERIVYLPMRGRDTPSPGKVAEVAGRMPFQSMSCLMECGKSSRFCSIGWDKTVAWCSYTRSRAKLKCLSYAGLCAAISGLGLEYCGEDHGA